jgi:ligand-binding sensor domain-containing protein
MKDRLKEINDIIDSIKSPKEYKQDIQKKMDDFYVLYKNELEDYKHVKTIDDLYNLKSAGYIRYIDLDGKLKYGGILLKVFKSDNEIEFYNKNLILIQNTNNKKWTISWENNYIFYKKQTKKGDAMRNLFISLIDNK